jgi:hypothetical protein
VIKFVTTIADDQPQIDEWMKADPYHFKNVDAAARGWWLTGAEGSMLAGGINDESGPVLYYRFDKEGDLARMHCQFPPPEQVEKRRIAQAISDALVVVGVKFQQDGLKGIIYESTSESLIRFMNKLGFKPCLESINDFVLLFEEN